MHVSLFLPSVFFLFPTSQGIDRLTLSNPTNLRNSLTTLFRASQQSVIAATRPVHQ